MNGIEEKYVHENVRKRFRRKARGRYCKLVGWGKKTVKKHVAVVVVVVVVSVLHKHCQTYRGSLLLRYRGVRR